MRPTQHASNNDVLEAPKGMSIEECTPLAVTRVEEGDKRYVLSFWRPSPAELQAIADGKCIYIATLGRAHPPLWLGVDGVDPN
jgi:hypothetical protein